MDKEKLSIFESYLTRKKLKNHRRLGRS